MEFDFGFSPRPIGSAGAMISRKPDRIISTGIVYELDDMVTEAISRTNSRSGRVLGIGGSQAALART